MRGSLASAIVLASIVCLAAPFAAATDVSGGIGTSVTWSAAGSPYVVVGDVRVRTGAVLTIDPGVEVRFEGPYEIYIEAGCSIVAEGTESERITFTSAQASPAPTDWKNVFVFGSPASSFRYCDFEYGTRGLYLNNSSPAIDRCRFSRCQTGIFCHSSSPLITGTEIVDCSSVGVFCLYSASVPTLNDCNIEGNADYSVFLNSYNVLPIVTIDATGNWWGTDDPGAIAETIYDNSDKPSLYGVVDFSDWLSAPGVEPASWGSIKALFRE